MSQEPPTMVFPGFQACSRTLVYLLQSHCTRGLQYLTGDSENNANSLEELFLLYLVFFLEKNFTLSKTPIIVELKFVAKLLSRNETCFF